MSYVNILLMSDLHFSKGHEDELIELSEQYKDAILGLDENWKPNIIAIAGDIGFSGAEEDYTFFAETFFEPLIKILEIKPDHVIACPGNHDKNDSCIAMRSKNKDSVTWKCINNLKTEKTREKHCYHYRLMCKDQVFILDDYAVKPFVNYINFLKSQGIKPFDIPTDDGNRPVAKRKKEPDGSEYLYGHREIEGIDFYCYNSAWDCLHYDKEDYGNLRIGPVEDRDGIKPKGQLAISLVHHPIDWLTGDSICRLKESRDKIADKKDIAVNGHMHAEFLGYDVHGEVLFIQTPTWASSDTDSSEWKSYILRIDLENTKFDLSEICFTRSRYGIHYNTGIMIKGHDLRITEKLKRARIEIHESLEHDRERLLRLFSMFKETKHIGIIQLILEEINRILEKTAKNAAEYVQLEQFFEHITSIISDEVSLEEKNSRVLDEIELFQKNIPTLMHLRSNPV